MFLTNYIKKIVNGNKTLDYVIQTSTVEITNRKTIAIE